MRRRIPLALAAASLLLVAPAAEAKKKKPKRVPVTIKTGVATTTADGQLASATATCPKGLIALGGGFSDGLVFVAPGSITDLHLVFESRRSGPGSWTASGVRRDQGGEGNPINLTASVICRTPTLKPKKAAQPKGAGTAKRKPKKLTLSEAVSNSPQVAMSQPATATATCPAGASAISGGFSSSPLPNASPQAFPLFNSTRRTAPDSWNVSMFNLGATPRTLTSHVYCSSRASTREVAAVTVLPASVSVLESAKALSPSCSKGRARVAGGFDIAQTSPTTATALFTESLAVGTGTGAWQSTAYNLSASNAGTIGSFAYCL
jgi:hypothetical protein